MTTAARNPSPPPPSGPTLLQRVAQGDTAAVRGCVDQYTDLVWSVARRFVPPAEAEDAVQDVFIDLWKSAARYDPGVASEAAFVVMIARRRLIDRLRRLSRRPAASVLPEWAEAKSPAGTAGNGAGAAERAAEIAEEAGIASRAMNQLSPEQRRVLQLAVSYGYTHTQISEITGLPLGTVKTHVRRGLIKVREMLETKENGPSPADSRPGREAQR